jgi:hypothetical protein
MRGVPIFATPRRQPCGKEQNGGRNPFDYGYDLPVRFCVNISRKPINVLLRVGGRPFKKERQKRIQTQVRNE